jgi:predicted amidohydrolase
MRAHLIQADTLWQDKRANHARIREMLTSAPARVRPGDLLVLPEMFDTGFSFALELTRDDDQTTLTFLRTLAKELSVTIVGARTTVGPEGKGRNCCPVITPDGTLACEYQKIHPFTFGREGEFFLGGDSVRTFAWNVGTESCTVCPTICYDLRFPELFRLGMLAGAQLFTVIANWPAPRAMHRRALGIARAIENQAYVLCVNRAGSDPHLTYSGESFAVGPKGDILGELGPEPGVLSVEIDMNALRAWRETFPAWRDVRLITPPRP